MDPFSVAASIVGILGAAVQISEILRPFVSTVKDAATVAAQINAEVNTCATILSALQGLLENLSQTPVERQSLIEVDSLTITLTEGVLIFDALVHLLRQLGNGKRWSTRIQWAWKRDTLDSLVKRMQLFKASVTLMLNILQSDSQWEARKKQEEHHAMLLQLLQDNEGLSHRLSQLEHLEHQAPDRESSYSNLQKRFSILSTDSGNRMFEFESDLRRSAVYRKVRRMATLRSNRSSVPESPAWTTLTEVTLSDISAASVMDLPLPISSGEISSLHHYLTTQNPSEETLIAPSSSYTEVTEPYTADKPSRNVSVHGEVTNPTDQSYMSSSSHENAGGKAYPVYDEGQSQTTLSSVLHPDPEIYKQAAEHWRPDDVYINHQHASITNLGFERFRGILPLTEDEIAFWQTYLEHSELGPHKASNIKLLRPNVASLLSVERPDLDFPRLNDVLGVMSEAAHIFVPIGQMRPISTHIRTDWTLLYVSCITNKSYHYSPSPFSNNGTLAQNITRNLSLLLGREIKYRHLGHAPEDNHGQHSDDSGVYLCILMKHLLAERLEVEVDKDPSNYVVDTVTGRKRLLDAIEAYKAYTNGAEMIRLDTTSLFRKLPPSKSTAVPQWFPKHKKKQIKKRSHDKKGSEEKICDQEILHELAEFKPT